MPKEDNFINKNKALNITSWATSSAWLECWSYKAIFRKRNMKSSKTASGRGFKTTVSSVEAEEGFATLLLKPLENQQ
jgi:hypothetical protein